MPNYSKATRSEFGSRNQRLCALLACILIFANDIETNPRPDTRSKGNPKDQSTRIENLWGNRPLHHEASGGHERTEEQDIRSILAEIFKKLGKLESLDSQLRLLNDKIDTIDQKQDELKQENKRLRNRAESLENKMAYQEGQSKRENLIFYGLPEITDETWDMSERDVRSLLTDKMGLDHAEDDNVISIERAHRLGRRRQQQDQPRPVVVKFSRYKHRQVVWNNRSKLKDTNYRVVEHFSDSVRERRRILIPRMEEERDRGNTAYLSFGKLRVDDRVFEVDRKTKEIVELKQHRSRRGSNST